MKLEIIERSEDKTIATYSVPNFPMFDFQEWKGESEVMINLDCLSGTVACLNSNDPEADKPVPVSDSRKVDFYLPDPIKNRVVSQFAKSQTESEDSNEVSERVYEPELKSSAILSAIVMEILQNHHPHSDYKVKISDG